MNELGLEWIKYFDQYIRSRTTNAKRLLILDGYNSYHLYEFEYYCKENNIVIFCISPYLSHLFQLFDIGYFNILKQLYSKEVENFIRSYINYIIKPDFFAYFYTAFFAIFGEENVRAGFQGTSFVLFNPEAVISKFDVKLHMLTPIGSLIAEVDFWVFKIL